MSSWASAIDEEIHYRDVLFVLVTGNLYRDDIRFYLKKVKESYPELFARKHLAGLQILNQSAFGITVRKRQSK